MRKIKRTITVRKVEFISNKQHDHELNMEICPLCHSPVPVLSATNDSAIEVATVEIPLQLEDKHKTEVKGDKND